MICPSCTASGTVTRERIDEIAGGLRRYYQCQNLHTWQTVEMLVDQTRVDRAQIARMLRQQREQLDRMAAVLGVES